jgi:hypothetical protein
MTIRAIWASKRERDLVDAIREFKTKLPGWWWRVGECSVSCDASCGPDIAGPDQHLLSLREFDEGFDVDLKQPSTLAEALKTVTRAALMARQINATQSPDPRTHIGQQS